MQQHLHHRLSQMWPLRAHPRLHRPNHLQGVSVLRRRHSSRLRLLDGGHIRRRDHHASAGPQRGPQRDGEGRPVDHADRLARHTRHAHAGPSDSMGRRCAQVLAQALDKTSSPQSHISK